jgi:hypothetical protein
MPLGSTDSLFVAWSLLGALCAEADGASTGVGVEYCKVC